MFTYSGVAASGDVGVGIAFSQTGAGGTWTDYGSNPIVALGEDPYVVKDLTTGKAYRDGDGIHVFSETKTAGSVGSQSGIQHHYSTDGVTWIADPANPIMSPGAAGWDSLDRTSPVVVYDGSQFVMFFEGRQSGSDGSVGVARKATISGTGWTHEASNPILAPVASTWRGASLVPDDVIKSGSTYVLLCHGYSGSAWTSGRFTTTITPGSWNSSSFTQMTGNPICGEENPMPANAAASKVVWQQGAGSTYVEITDVVLA